MTPEGQLKADVVSALKASGLFFLRINSGIVKVRGGFLHLAPEGTADLIVWPQNRTVWVELKLVGQATAKARKQAQAAFREKVLAAGHEHLTAYSVEDVMRAVGGEQAKTIR